MPMYGQLLEHILIGPLNDLHFCAREYPKFIEYLWDGVLGEGVGMKEDRGEDFEVMLDLIEHLVLVKDDHPRLNPAGN